MALRPRSLALRLLGLLAAALLPLGAALAMAPEEIDRVLGAGTDASRITSPLIEAAALSRGSVVGVNNYQVVTATVFGIPLDLGFTLPSSEETLVGSGSGVVVSALGHVLTNWHVAQDAGRLSVQLEGREYPALLVGADPGLDLAVLLAPGLSLPPAPLGDSDALQVGEWVLVIGNPLGSELERSVTAGIVSALDRSVTGGPFGAYLGGGPLDNRMIQVDAAINQGNSGGGLFNVLGQLQGIPSVKFSAPPLFSAASVDNIGLCIPVNAAKPLLRQVFERSGEDLLRAEEAREAARPKPRLGVTVSTLSPDYRLVKEGRVPPGAYVRSVEAGSPAGAAGLKEGDIITALNGRGLLSSTELVEGVSALSPGDQATLTVFRLPGFPEVLDGKRPASSLGAGESLELKVSFP